MTTADDYAVQIALKRGLVTAGQLEAAQRKAADHPALTSAAPGVLDILLTDAALDQAALGRAVADEFGMPWVTLAGMPISPAVLATLPRSFVVEHTVIPFAREGGVLRVAVADPIAVDVIDSLAYLAGTVVQPVLASVADVRQAITRYYSGEVADLDAASGNEPAAAVAVASGEEGQASDHDAPIIKLVHTLIAEAIRRRASDIHLEPLERRFRVRYRIDGVLLEADAPPKRLQLAVISRLKIMANISIAEKRVPQDGRIQVNLGGRTLDLRVSSLPTAHGESIVMRILDKEGLKLGMPELGFLPDDQGEFEQLIASPDGIMLVTGPTGSGKTTTLYASLHHLNQPDRKIITVEEPVEYQLSGINQVPVNAAIGMTFAAALRAMLRQAPNIVMVGEIRDLETAEIAINASLTGHLVFSTLHTNDAPSAVTRLIDIGAKPFLVAAALRSVMAQRLVRRICAACKRPYTPAAHELHALGLKPGRLEGATFAHGAGCAACHGTGYQGRMGIFEIFRVHDGIRAMIYDNVTAARLRAQARQDGMRTMREDGVRKVLAGLTTIEEVVTVTVGDPL
ncbi:GspE/PulE family protein [Opitutus sp. GAS368]|uniref:GspE/PulE family protein n=1 Tax=Opitutus sp. GAS368 TaxID=1882749 RepID=UPI00087ADB7B|nr:GspE/PulE family protein [Opitutus sp. GAS368]SDS61752.1 general secretion pathway protein E/type IV pilus assembly protein PilB [Opitutus sp. GAS368]